MATTHWFGSVRLIRLIYDEFMFYIIEHKKVDFGYHTLIWFGLVSRLVVFGSFRLICLLYDEFMFYIIEHK